MNRTCKDQGSKRCIYIRRCVGDQHRIRLDQNSFFTCPTLRVLHCPNNTLLMSSKNRHNVCGVWERRLVFQTTSLSYLLATGISLHLFSKPWTSLVSLTT